MTRALVIGCAACVWDDYKAARALCDYDLTVVVGSIGTKFPDKIDHWVTFHPRFFDKWANLRRGKGFPEPLQYWSACFQGHPLTLERNTNKRLTSMDVTLFKWDTDSGSSGLLGVFISLQFADKIVLAGIPMTKSGGRYDSGKSWNAADKYWEPWLKLYDKLAPHVRSLSGRTRVTFGFPTEKWLMTP